MRDLLLGREPGDYDVATDATPDQVMNIFPRTFAVGAQFGVVLVPDAEEQTVEVATFRSDGLYSDGRRPDEVRYTRQAREDVQRRDFTINGLLLDPLTNDAAGKPQVLDHVGGRADLERGIVRTIGEPKQRFAEDKLRLLRAVRFAARLGYTIEEKTFTALREQATEIKQVSRERVRDELVKMLTEGRARPAFGLLEQSGLLAAILPEVAKMKGVKQPPQFHPEGDVWTHTLMMLEALPAGCPAALALGALLHDVGKPPTFRVAPDRIRFDNHAEVGARMAEEICGRLRLSNDESEQVVALVAEHMRFAEVKRMRESTLKKFLRMPHFDQHLEMHRIDCGASHGMLDLYEFLREKLAATPAEAMRPRPLMTGDDLIRAGYAPGPRFKQILGAVEDAQLEGRVATAEAAMEMVKREFPND